MKFLISALLISASISCVHLSGNQIQRAETPTKTEFSRGEKFEAYSFWTAVVLLSAVAPANALEKLFLENASFETRRLFFTLSALYGLGTAYYILKDVELVRLYTKHKYAISNLTALGSMIFG
jgi:hypothetical protein